MAGFDPSDWYGPAGPGDALCQGDQLFGVTLLRIGRGEQPGDLFIEGYQADVIVATQSCDLEQRKVSQVEVVPFYPLSRWLARNPHLLGDLESIRRGHSPGLYLLPGWPGAPIAAATATRVVAFDEKRGVDWDQMDVVLATSPRLGLRSPYVEHFAQAVARFYMRIGLPEDIPEVAWNPLPPDPTELPERRAITAEELAAGGLPVPARPLRVQVQPLGLREGPDVLYRALLERDTSCHGVGATAEESVRSLILRLARKRAELPRQPRTAGKRPHWLQTEFQE